MFVFPASESSSPLRFCLCFSGGSAIALKANLLTLLLPPFASLRRTCVCPVTLEGIYACRCFFSSCWLYFTPDFRINFLFQVPSRGPRPIMAATSPIGSPPSALALGALGLTPSAPSREMGCSAMCSCVCGYPAVRGSVTGRVRGIRSPQHFTLKAVPRIKNAFLQLRKPNDSESRHLRFTTDCTSDY